MKGCFSTIVIIGFILFGFAQACSNSFSTTSSYASGRDVYGLLASDYDKNGWAVANGKWVSNPRQGASIKYSRSQVIATSSGTITGTVIQNNTTANPYRNFASIRETYPILERVAKELEYSDISALRNSFSRYRSLASGQYWIEDGYKFYSNQALFDYKIQKAQNWGSRNDQTGDGHINCQDYAELFYKYAMGQGYHVRYIVNSGLNHAFNSVNVNGSWIPIEPQAAENNGLEKSPLLSSRWPNYNPYYDSIKKEN
jgi:hypothetical protein